MSAIIHYVIKPENLRAVVEGLPKGKTLDYLYMFLSIITNNCNSDLYYFIKNEELTQVLFTETYPSLIDYLISNQMFDNLISTISLFLQMSNVLCILNKFTFLPYLKKLFEVTKKISTKDVFIEFQLNLKFINEDVVLNIFQRFLIDQLAKEQIVKVMINTFLNYPTFSECSDFFSIFNSIFPYVKKTVLQTYAQEFSRYSYSLEDPRFDEKESLNLTKAMATCSTKYAQIHFENIVKFLLSDDNEEAKIEFVNLIRNYDNLNAISQNMIVMFDVILASMREDEKILSEISSILIFHKICDKNFFIEKAGTDLCFNLAFFDLAKESYSNEIVKDIIESETFCEKTVDFVFKIIEYQFDLISDLPLFFQKSFSSFWNEERMEGVLSLSKKEKGRLVLLDSINGYEISNEKEFKIVCQILTLLKPSVTEFKYDTFASEILYYVDSIFILPFLSTNSFIPANLIDIEELVSFSVFNENLSNFLLLNFSDILNDHIEFFMSLNFESESQNKSLGKFLFTVFKNAAGSSSNKLIWEAVIRLQDEDEEVHLLAQKLINEHPEQSQEEILDRIEEGYSKFFINFDFSTFSECSVEDNGNCLFFRKPKIASSDSFFYFPSKVGHALNNSEPIELSDVNELFECQLGDIGIDTVILEMAFDASVKLNIDFQMLNESLNLAFQLRFKKFVDKLFQYILKHDKKVIQIDEEILNSFSKFDEKYVIDLIKEKKVPTEISLSFFSKYQTFESSSILRKLDFEIQSNLLNQIIYTKDDFIDFFQSNRISPEILLPYLFSSSFPQFQRTQKVMTSLFQFLQSHQSLLSNFLKSKKHENVDIKNRQKIGFSPKIESPKYFNVYLAFALILPDLSSFNKPEIGTFLSSLVFSREGEEDADLSVPLKEPIDETGKQKVDKNEVSRYLLNQALQSLFSELPNDELKKFEFFYSTKNLVSVSNSGIFHDFSMIINENTISKELEKYVFLSHPDFLLFKVHTKKEFEIEERISINSEVYSLSLIVTKSALYVTKSSSEGTKYTRYLDGEKSVSKSIESKIVFAIYQLKNSDEKIEKKIEFEKLKEQFKKFRSCTYKFNERAVICDSLNKAKIEWNKWDVNNSLFETATVLLCDYGYTNLFKELSTNVEFSEYFFNSDWKEIFSLKEIDHEMVNLAKIYPRRDELLQILINSIQNDSRKRFLSIIFNSLDLSDEYIEKVIKTISPSFDHYEDFIYGYFMKPTTTNSLLLQDDKLSTFVFNLINNRSSIEKVQSFESLPFANLLNPMTEPLFIVCMKTLGKKASSLIFNSLPKSSTTTFVLHSLTCLPHSDELASLFAQIEAGKNAEAADLRKDVEWVEYGLSSSNDKIRRHAIELMKAVFGKKDSELLSFALKGAVLKSLFCPFLEELKDFVFDNFGYRSIDSPDFTSLIYDRLFSSPVMTANYPVITRLFDHLSPPCRSSIIKWHSAIKEYQKDEKTQTVFLVYSSDLIYASIQSTFKPPVAGFFEDILKPITENCAYQSLKAFFQIFEGYIGDGTQKIFDYVPLIIEFEVIVSEYIPFVTKLIRDYSDFRETELTLLVVNLPAVVLKRQKLIQTALKSFTNVHKLMIEAVDSASEALLLIQQKKAFNRKSGRDDISQLMDDIYSKSFLPFFITNVYAVITSFGTSKIPAVKKMVKFLTLSALIFPDVLAVIFDMIYRVAGLMLFTEKLLQSVEREWSELCCEISRQILADIVFNDIENRKRSVTIIDRELCCQLYHYNQAEKEYLRFLVAVMKNDQLRIETKLVSNPQIFKVFRSDFVFCIDDVAAFIDVSLEKYENFFDADEIKNFILNLKIRDNQIKQKLKIVSLLFTKSQDKMKDLIEEVFPKIEELNSNEGLDDELTELLNNVFEKALEVLSLI
ncbi:hypothetical protein M9Y10_010478 [Tritrichomonas musculus]|uniref:HECT domain-containing protein n=1 Tax=Tritrichomonas musculus TaxID=1915356 RepID=A0ABR2IKT3_9EUKA